jgi:DNA modification methylase
MDKEKYVGQQFTLYNENCLVALADIPDNSVDMVLVDLPYG